MKTTIQGVIRSSIKSSSKDWCNFFKTKNLPYSLFHLQLLYVHDGQASAVGEEPGPCRSLGSRVVTERSDRADR